MGCPYVLDPTGRDVQGEAAAIAARGPVTQIELPGGVRAWSVNSYRGAKQAYAGPAISKDPRQSWPAFIRGEIPADWELISWVRMDSMAIADGADHSRLRGLVARSFTTRKVEAMRPMIESTVDKLLTDLAAVPLGEVVDLRDRFTYLLPATVICDLFGVPEQARPGALRGGRVAVDTTLSPEEAAANLHAWQQALAELIQAKKQTPGDDLTTDLVRAMDRDGMSESELVGSLFMLFGAGSMTVMNLLGTSVAVLLTHPDQHQLIRAGTASWDDFVEEVMRVEPPIVNLPMRYATADIEVDGTTIPAGEPIMISLAAVGRDPALSTGDNASFDVTRAGREHLSFGHGPHFCLGATLAKLQATIALPALLDRFPELSLAVAPEQIEPLHTFIMNGPEHLPVRLT
jgi:2-hydroxy-5-methyl-1-naphthoate 7-hydroxylase